MAPGGRLVYATCSSEPDENEDVVRRFLDTRTDFTLRPLVATGPLAPFVDRAGMFRTSPPRDALEAFFAAVLVRNPGVVRSESQ